MKCSVCGDVVVVGVGTKVFCSGCDWVGVAEKSAPVAKKRSAKKK